MDKSETRSLLREFSLRVVQHLQNGPARFNDVARLPGAPAAPLLAKHLRRLTRDGLVERNVVTLGPPAWVEYSLTPLGRSMVRPASAMVEWLDHNRGQIDNARGQFQPNDKADLVADDVAVLASAEAPEAAA